jgi:hypothetical protein
MMSLNRSVRNLMYCRPNMSESAWHTESNPMSDPTVRPVYLSDHRVVWVDADDPHTDDEIREALEGPTHRPPWQARSVRLAGEPEAR